MKKKISDMMDYIQDDSVNIQIKNIASSQKILEATRSKLHTDRKIHDTDNIIPRPVRRFSAALIAAVLILSLSVTAFAYVGFVAYENPVAMLNAFSEKTLSQKAMVLLSTTRMASWQSPCPDGSVFPLIQLSLMN